MPRYKFRPEVDDDVSEFLTALGQRAPRKIEIEHDPKFIGGGANFVACTFESEMTLDELISIAFQYEDLRVIAETINVETEFTPARDYRRDDRYLHGRRSRPKSA